MSEAHDAGPVKVGFKGTPAWVDKPGMGIDENSEVLGLFISDSTRLWKVAVQSLRLCENLEEKKEGAAGELTAGPHPSSQAVLGAYLGLYREIHSLKGTASLLSERVNWAKRLHRIEDALSLGLDKKDFSGVDLAAVTRELENIGEELVVLRENFHADREAA